MTNHPGVKAAAVARGQNMRKVSRQEYAEILELAKAGSPPSHIWQKFPHIDLDNIQQYICKARQRGEDIPKFPSGRRLKQDLGSPGTITIKMRKIRNRKAFTEAAIRRGVTETFLMHMLVATAINENMIDAILDDGK